MLKEKIQKLKCKFGFHDWVPVTRFADTPASPPRRRCYNCKKYQTGSYDSAYGSTNWK